MNIPKFIVVAGLLSGCISQVAVADVFSFTPSQPIPDGQPAGISDVETISSAITNIGFVQVTLNISGNFNGDLYCYLQHSNALSVLLNRPGRSAGNPFGYADSGFSILLNDSATNGNVHTYEALVSLAANTPLTGEWQPDGRTNSPATVLDTDPSVAGLGAFNGLNANGDWTLFIADLSPGGSSVLDSWQLVVSPVPEPPGWSLGLFGVGAAVMFARWRSKTSQR